ncbi:UDP-N-acetylmuramoyl-L-alanine--D-glutamate ligase [Limnohabitans sp.]|uniref:UDP-N-acetylmuramoyl-L-alanine--D-glutamate ligase n=1 Tax=Limnohabitans sp. TaxID=1907725 RepID=UPI00286EE9AB|nr:UDP-N-acetylmuramoyl-L-alanine--D-glutamate ligase [Limnohabitans sp.]
MQKLHNQSVLILGLGDSGLAMARWCVRNGAQVQVVDTRAEPPHLAVLRAELPHVKFLHAAFAASLVAGQDVRAVFKSPGLSPESVAPVWNAAVAAGLWVGTELTLFAQALSDLQTSMAYHPKVLAITGTNGKTTVTALTGQLLERAGKRVAVAGNIGPTLLDTLSQALDKAAEEQAAADVIAAQEAAELAADEVAAEGDTESQMALTGTEAEQAKEQGEEAAQVAAADDEPYEVDLPPLVPPPPPPADHPFLPQVWVLELSSFQLEGVDNFEPTAATVLNLTQDHLDWHGSMEGYAAAKTRIFGKQGMLVLNREDTGVMAMLDSAPVEVTEVVVKSPRAKTPKVQVRAHLTFGGDMPQRPGDYGIETVNGMTWLVRALEADETRKRRKDDEEEIHFQRLMPADALRIRGRHNALNALAALALAGNAGGDLAPMLFGLREYQGEPHRVEAVTILNGVEYFDDSKGTNVGATVAALHGLGVDRRLVVILGGDGKGQDFSPLAAPVSRFARAVVLIGRDAPALREVLQHSGVKLLDAASLEEAVKLCSEQAHSGDAVLLSPACASMDMFRNYAHRADVFVSAVNHLVDEAGGLA